MLPFLTQISDELSDFQLINGEQGLNFYTCNSMLIKDVLIDTGFSNNYLRALLERFEVKRILYSHWHEDHIAGSSLLKERQFFCHEKDRDVIEDVSLMAGRYGYEGLVPDDGAAECQVVGISVAPISLSDSLRSLGGRVPAVSVESGVS